MDDPFRERRLPATEVRRVLRRALELAETDVETEATESSMSAEEVLRNAAALGIPTTSLKLAMREEAPNEVIDQGGGILGHPLRTLLEEEIEGEVGPELHEDLADAIQVVTGDAGRVQIVGKTFTWQPTITAQNPPRMLTVTVRARNGKTLIRVDERHTNLALGLFLGLGLGLGLGGGIPLVGGLAAAFKSVLICALGFVGLAFFAFLMARTIYAIVARRRTRSHGELLARLRAAVLAARGEVPVKATRRDKKRIKAVEPDADSEAEAEAIAEAEAAREKQKA